MAALPAEIRVKEFSDPNESVPSDDQAIVFSIDRTIPNISYLRELNKYVKDDTSFLFVSRISRDRLCVVLREAAQASMLVDNVNNITVNDFNTQIDYLVAKAVKVNISNAGYSVTNSAIKRFLTQTCKIRTASSVSFQKANSDPEGKEFKQAINFRRIVYIHPEDVNKLPKGPMKFSTPGLSYNVFFDIDSPKCFLCGQSDHFRRACPKNTQISSQQNELSASQLASREVRENLTVVNVVSRSAEEAAGSPESRSVPVKQAAAAAVDNLTAAAVDAPSSESLTPRLSEQNVNADSSKFSDVLKSTVKRTRPESFASSETTDPGKNLAADLFPFPHLPPPLSSERVLERQVRKKKKTAPNAKKMKTGDTNGEDRINKILLLLEPARAHIEASHESHHLTFESLANLVALPHTLNSEERRKRIDSDTGDILKLSELLDIVHTLVVGKSIKKKITQLKNFISNIPAYNSTSEASLDTEGEYSDASQSSQPGRMEVA